MSQRVGTLIVGGGIAGCAFAHYLAQEGETDILLVEADELGSGSTGGSLGGLLGATYTPRDGKVTPTDGVSALAKAATGRGVRIREHWDLKSLEKSGSGWRVTGPEVVDAGRVVLCTGYWSSDLLRSFGLEL